MKKWIAVVAMMLAAVPMARADEASKTAKVHALFQAMHMEKMMGVMMNQVTAMMQQQVDESLKNMDSSEQMSDAQRALTKEYLAKVMGVATDSMGWKALEPEYTKIYAATYSEDEIDAITAFYSSPAGQAMLDKTPEVTAASMKIVQAKMVELQPKMKAMQEEYVQKMKDYKTEK